MGVGARVHALVNRFLPRTSFVRNVGVLAGGTALAQAIGVLALPIITRLYSPADFSVLAVYASTLGVVVAVACLRLDIAIPLPARDEDAANLLIVALLSSAALGMLAALSVWLFRDQIMNFVGRPGLEPLLWMIPMGIWLGSAFSAVQYWTTRKNRFAEIARTRVSQTTCNTATQLAIGMSAALGPFGLMLGQLIASGTGILALGPVIWRKDRQAFHAIGWTNMRKVLRTYDRFPKYSTIEAFANSGAIYLPVIIIATVNLESEAGHLFLAMTAMAIPIGLIGNAVTQVYLSRAPEEYRKGQLAAFTLEAISGLVRTGVGPLILAGIVSPVVIPFAFGDEWKRTGDMVTWMMPWFVMQFVSSPVSMSLHVTGNLKVALYLQIFGFILRVGGAWLATLLVPKHVFEIYAATGFVFYMIYFVTVARVAKIEKNDLMAKTVQQSKILTIWIASGIGVLCAVPLISQTIAQAR